MHGPGCGRASYPSPLCKLVAENSLEEGGAARVQPPPRQSARRRPRGGGEGGSKLRVARAASGGGRGARPRLARHDRALPLVRQVRDRNDRERDRRADWSCECECQAVSWGIGNTGGRSRGGAGGHGQTQDSRGRARAPAAPENAFCATLAAPPFAMATHELFTCLSFYTRACCGSEAAGGGHEALNRAERVVSGVRGGVHVSGGRRWRRELRALVASVRSCAAEPQARTRGPRRQPRLAPAWQCRARHRGAAAATAAAW